MVFDNYVTSNLSLNHHQNKQTIQHFLGDRILTSSHPANFNYHALTNVGTLIKLEVNVTRHTHLLDDGGEPAQSEPVAVLPGDDGAAHLDDDPPGVLQLVPVEDGAAVLGREEVRAQRDLAVGAAPAGARHRERPELAADHVVDGGHGGAGVEAAVEHPSL